MEFEVIRFPVKQHEGAAKQHPSASVISCLSDTESVDWFTSSRQEDKISNLLYKTTPLLIGRAEELSALSETYFRALSGSSEACIVHGPSGVGKTALVETGLRDYMAREDLKGFFAGGTFEQKIGLPYASIGSCLTDLVDLVMQHECVNEIKAAINVALGSEIGMLLHLVSNLRFLMNITEDCVQTDTPSLHFQSQSLNHLKLLCSLLVTAIATPSHPVVLFFDDAQWADKDSCALIEALIADVASQNVIVVIAFREEEVVTSDQSETPVGKNTYSRVALREVCAWPITEIPVGCLQAKEVNELICGLLRRENMETQGLSDIILNKTKGNAYHIVQYLGSLESRELLEYCQVRGHWRWRMDDIVTETNDDSILSLVSKRLQEMNAQEIECLRLAAFIGHSFDSEFLVELIIAYNEISTPQTFNANTVSNRVAVQQRVNLSLHLATKKSLLEQSGKHSSTYKFLHTSIHEAFYKSLDNQLDAMELHLRFGRIVRNRLLDKQSEDYVSLILATEHLNKGKDMMSDPNERVALASLNLRAAKLSALRSSYHTDFLENAILLIGDADGRWERHYEVCLEVFSTASEHSVSCGRHEKGKRLAQEVVKKARSPGDKVRAYSVWIHILGMEGFLSEACEVASKALRELGEPFPKRITLFHVLREFARVCKALKGMKDEELNALPLTEEEGPKGIAHILGTLSLFAFYSEEKWTLPYISLRCVYLSLRDGISSLTSQSFVMLGAIFARTSGHRKAMKFGRLGVNMLQHTHDPAAHARTAVLFYSVINHWQRPLEESIEPLVRSYELGAKGGDHYFSLNAGVASAAASCYCGQPLVEVEEDFNFLGKRANELNHGPITAVIRPVHQLLHNLLGRSDNPLILSGEVMNEDDLTAENLKTKNQLGARCINHTKLILFVHLGSWNSCQGIVQEFLKKEGSLPYSMTWIGTFYCGIASFELSKTSTTNKRRYRVIGRNIVKKMTAWVRAGVVNCEPQLLILKAEEKSALGVAPKASLLLSEVFECYREAIASCGNHNFPHYEAFANERAADVLMEQHQYGDARRYAEQAYRLYARWQANAKLRALSAKYGSSISLCV